MRHAHPTMSYGEDAWTLQYKFLVESQILSLGSHKHSHIPTDGVSALFHSLEICGTTINIHKVTFLSLEEYVLGTKHPTMSYGKDVKSKHRQEEDHLSCSLETNYTYILSSVLKET